MNRHARHAAFALAVMASAVATTTAVRAETFFDLTTEFVFCQEVFPPPQPGLPPGLGGGFCTPSPESPVGLGEFPWVGGRTYWRNVFYYYRFTYSDDGQATGDSTFESATLSFTPQQTGVSYQIDVLGATADALSIVNGPALVLGSNDHPDSFSGTIRVYVTNRDSRGVLFGGITPVLSIDSASDGGVAPIPEPSTFVLSLAGLGAIGWMARRRGVAAPMGG
jgi:PEP-CTERM motif